MLPFLIVVTLLTFLLPPAVEMLFSDGAINALPSFLYPSTWLMAFVTTVIFLYLYKVAKPSQFVQLYLLSMVVKLLACLAFILLVVLKDRAGAVANTVYSVVVYFLFTIAEVVFLYAKISGSGRR